MTLIGPEARGFAVRYVNDNYATVRVVEYGSTKEECHEVARRINDIVEHFDIKLEMI